MRVIIKYQDHTPEFSTSSLSSALVNTYSEQLEENFPTNNTPPCAAFLPHSGLLQHPSTQIPRSGSTAWNYAKSLSVTPLFFSCWASSCRKMPQYSPTPFLNIEMFTDQCWNSIQYSDSLPRISSVLRLWTFEYSQVHDSRLNCGTFKSTEQWQKSAKYAEISGGTLDVKPEPDSENNLVYRTNAMKKRDYQTQKEEQTLLEVSSNTKQSTRHRKLED